MASAASMTIGAGLNPEIQEQIKEQISNNPELKKALEEMKNNPEFQEALQNLSQQ